MKISKSWIVEWLDSSINVKDIYKSLNKSGIEVENFKKVFINNYNLCYGKILSRKKIVLRDIFFFKYNVKIKKNKFLKILSKFKCNVNKIFVLSICKNSFPQRIFDSLQKYHHSSSEGFLCSPFSIGVSTKKKQPVELSEYNSMNKIINKNFYICDYIIKLNIPYNRIEELSVLGISREIYSINNILFPNLINNNKNISYVSNFFNVYVEENINNYSYVGRIFNKINFFADTPEWMLHRLKINGFKNKNVLKNIINYVFLELGESFHIFNIDSGNKKIFIKILKNFQKICVNKKIFFLKKNVLVICNKKKILVFGNNYNTENFYNKKKHNRIFLGSLFLKDSVFKNYKKNSFNEYNINYFKYSTNLKIQLFALNYITKLILRICGGDAEDIFNIKNVSEVKKKKIVLFKNKIKKIIGIKIPNIIIEKILYTLGYKFYKNKFGWNIVVPYWRKDILIEEDVISDILRIYGIDRISNISPLEKCQIHKNDFLNYNILKKIKYFLKNIGYNEVINYSFIDIYYKNIFCSDLNDIIIKNPISKNMSVMRSSLWPCLLNNFIYNKNRQQDHIRLFESGYCFIKDKKKYLGINQKFLLSGILYGKLNKLDWSTKERDLDFYDLKGDIESILKFFRLDNNVTFIKEKINGLKENFSFYIFLNKKCIGKFGKLSSSALKKNNFKKKFNIFLFEIYFDDINKKQIFKINKISSYPKIIRDISIIVSENIKYIKVTEFFKKIFKKYLIEFKIFDLYTGSKIPKGKKSISIRLVLQSLNKTLKESYIDNIIENNMKILKLKFNAIIKCK
ncbi:phenylalanine--tRNA ligase subunit beta [Buchnera aphidicola (Ceratoglyphina bambusae)]|uniref:phenylalanine--tRNA ligase subunit beta n=1 Tax=Buchnera aphidicola TaxID=9 RepID=UPI0031B87AF9